MFNPMQAAQELTRQRNQVKTTVIKIEEYQIDTQDPKKSKIIGLDMFEKDENGIPKRVEVRHFNDKSNGINEFANPSALMHTEVGGLIRLSKYKVDGSGAYVTDHMQRISKNGNPKTSASQDKYDVSFMKGWTKIYPKRDPADTSKLAIFERGGRLFHRADVMVVPEDAAVTQMNFGADTFEAELDKALNNAIDMAPRGTQPMLLVRMPGQLKADEIRLSNFKMDDQQNAVPLTKEEMIENAKTNSKLATSYIPSHKQARDAGQTGQCEFVSGFALGAIGMKWDGRSMQKNPQTGQDEPKYAEKSLIENFISETAQRHPLPKEEGATKTQYVLDAGAPQYSYSVLSYRTKRVPEGQHVQSDLDTLGRDHGVKLRVSPNAGLDEKPNPYKPAQPTAQQQAAPTNQAANQPTQPAAQQQPPVSQGQPAGVQQTAAINQPQAAAQQTAQETPQTAPVNHTAQQTTTVAAPTTSTPEVEEVDDLAEQTDFGLDDFADSSFEVDMDDIEEQLSSQGL
ncbi:hypothetical protein Maqu_4258 (plasmid) [Marinobacter nauticus VT8]|uniref:Uncharacterized protein n=2 Tax=Marinobacter nauticus TaxID=2743 RepID=A1U7Z0_MARN8|nr:hypothetical protein Maqu_4258 [Marinobacter nauticus VT8]